MSYTEKNYSLLNPLSFLNDIMFARAMSLKQFICSDFHNLRPQFSTSGLSYNSSFYLVLIHN